MRKKLILVISLVMLASLMICFATSCKKSPKDSGTSDSSSSTGGEDVQTDSAITIGEESVTIYEYEDYTIEYTVFGTVEKPVWKSSNESVATVKDGVVYGLSAGKANITATLDKSSASLEVVVNKTIYAPKLAVTDNVTIELNDTYTDSVVTLWNGSEIENNSFKWSLADGEADGIVELNYEKNNFSFKALKVGKTAYYISTDFRGTTVNAKVSVTVVDNVLSIIPVSSDIMPENDGYCLNLWSDAVGGITYADVSFAVSLGNRIIENAEITWNNASSDYDESIASIEKKSDGLFRITKQSVGKTYIVGTYTENGKTASIKLYLAVNKAVVVIDYNATIEVERLAPIAVPSGVEGQVNEFLLNGNNVLKSVSGTQITLDKELLPTTAKKLGKGIECVFVTDNVNYLFKSDVYSLVIKTVADLNSFESIAKKNGGFGKGCALLDGYFVLGNDIAYNGRFETPTDTNNIYESLVGTGIGWGNTATNGFRGVFDGRGYNIDGITICHSTKHSSLSGGFIGYLNDDGIVRNISFTNAVVEENNGLICAVGGGLIENISVVYKSLGVGNTTENLDTYPRKMGSFFSYLNGSKATVRNCFVDITKAQAEDKIFYKVGASGSSNLTVGTRADKVENFIIVGGNETYAKEYGTKTYAFSYEELAANKECQKAINSLGDAWEIVDGVPTLKKGI